MNLHLIKRMDLNFYMLFSLGLFKKEQNHKTNRIMELKNLFNLSSESLEKLDLALANLPAEAKVASSEANWNDCVSCKGGSCTTGFGGD